MTRINAVTSACFFARVMTCCVFCKSACTSCFTSCVPSLAPFSSMDSCTCGELKSFSLGERVFGECEEFGFGNGEFPKEFGRIFAWVVKEDGFDCGFAHPVDESFVVVVGEFVKHGA